MSVRLTIATANIGRGVPPAEARRNIVRVRHGFPAALIGWQEIDEADTADEHAILEHTFGVANYHNVAFRQAVPISVPRPWTVVRAEVRKACDFIPHATPNRYVVSALIAHPDLASPIWIQNGHYNLPRLGGKEGPKRWRDCQRAWVEQTAENHAEGLTILTTRDSNRLRRMPKIHPTERQLLPNAIARISVVPGSVAVKVLDRPVVNLTIDGHDAKGVELLLMPRAESARN